MDADSRIFGAKAEVRIRYEGPMEDLAATLSKRFILKDFCVENDEYPPHELCASLEVLGFEGWLHRDSREPFTFLFSIQTEHCINEMSSGRMHDLSPWLARFISDICRLDCRPVEPESGHP